MAPTSIPKRVGGLPTDIDVRALFEAFGVPNEGVVIPYETVAAVIKSPVTSNRWKTVTGRWRRRLVAEHNVYMLARDGAFSRRDPAQRIELGAGDLRSAYRRVRRSHIVTEGTDRSRLTEEQKKQADHILMTTGALMSAARLQARNEKPSLPKGVGA